MKVALVQLESSITNISINELSILKYVNKAINDGVKLICFPEMALCGYSLENIKSREIEQRELIKKLYVVSKKSNITICIGGIEQSNSDPDKYYITQYVIAQTITGYRKTHLGQREKAVFSQGNEIPVFNIDGTTFGIMTCYDGHFPELTSKMALKGAQFILHPSASPSETWKRLKFWKRYLVARAYDNRVWIMALNLCFCKKGGGILVYDGNGDVISETETNENKMIYIDFKHTTYNTHRMCNRDFKADRRDDLYE